MVSSSIASTLLGASRTIYAAPHFSSLVVASTSTARRYINNSSRHLAEMTRPLDDLLAQTGGQPRAAGSVSEQSKKLNHEAKNNVKTTPTHSLHVKSSRNNIILTYTDDSKGGKVFRTITGGIDKDFKKAHRSSYEAAHQAALKVFKAIEEHGQSRIRVAFNGIFGQGREAVAAALAGPEGARIRTRVVKVEDRTPIKIGGTRAKKPRRL
jgi:ribosomal protein S11